MSQGSGSFRRSGHTGRIIAIDHMVEITTTSFMVKTSKQALTEGVLKCSILVLVKFGDNVASDGLVQARQHT